MVADGSHTLAAVAEDTAGNYATSSIGITVRNNPPVISSISSGIPTTTSATITWTTDEAATSQVNYGTTTSYGIASSSATLATSHSIALTGLTASTAYHFQVQSVDSQGNTATSSDQTFTTASGYVGPCDILANAGTPCVAAHSVTRKMWADYTGYAFQLERTSDSTTLNVGFNANGTVNTAPITTFCAGTTCNYSIIYDQMNTPSLGNNLPQVTVADQSPYTLSPYPTGTPLPILSTISGQYYRNRTNTVDMPTGSSSITEYEVSANYETSDCCGSYGDMEATVSDTGTGHMFALAYTDVYTEPPQVGIDHENGGTDFTATVPTVFSLFAKHNQVGSTTTIKLGNAISGTLSTLYSGADPVSFDLEGGLSLGEGGDGSPAPTAFFEGVVVAGATSDATDAAVQANIVAFYGLPASPAEPTGPLDIASGAAACFSLRACDAALANGTTKAINIRRASDNATTDIDILSSGYLDTTTAASFCASTTCYVDEWYDQTGNGYNLTQASTTAQPELVLSGGPTASLPYISCNGSSQYLLSGSITGINQPFTFSAVSERTGAFTTSQAIFSAYKGSGALLQYPSAGGNKLELYAGSGSGIGLSTGGFWHATEALANGASSTLMVDGVAQSLSVSTGVISSNALGVCANNDSAARQFLTGNLYEAILWPSNVVTNYGGQIDESQHAIGGGW